MLKFINPHATFFCDIKTGHTPSLSWLRQSLQKKLPVSDGLTYGKIPGKRAFPIHVHTKPDLYITPQIRQNHVWEEFETHLFLDLLKHDDIFLDIGANIGWYSVVAAMGIWNAGRVYAFEPDPDNFAVLAKNMESLRHFTGHAISAQHCAIGENSGKGKLFLALENMGDHRIYPEAQGRVGIDINIKSLDDIFYHQSAWPTIVKIDVQGAEIAVINGAKLLFANGWRPVILFEFWPYGLRNAGKNAYDLWTIFTKSGYRMFEILPDSSTLRELTDACIQERLETPGMKVGEHFMDIVAIPGGSERIEICRAFTEI